MSVRQNAFREPIGHSNIFLVEGSDEIMTTRVC